MKITAEPLEDSLAKRAQQEAQKRGTTFTALIEQGLQLVLSQSPPERPEAWVRLPVSEASGGTLPGVDLCNNATLLDLLESN